MTYMYGQLSLLCVLNIQITTVPTCLSFQIEENVKIDEPKPGYVEVYDYYEKGKTPLCVR